MLSRRGQVPRGHILYEPWPVEADEVPKGNVLKIWRWLRKRAGQGNWRAVVDSMALWRERLFAWMLKSSESAMEFFRLPINRVIELGSQVQI